MQEQRALRPVRPVLQPEPRGRPVQSEQPGHRGVQEQWGRSTVQ